MWHAQWIGLLLCFHNILLLWYDLRGWRGVTHQESITLFSSTFWLFVPLRSVDGVWEEWGTWSMCSRTCGNGTRSRNRTCTGPFYGGRDCEGDPDHWERCNTFNCPGMPLHHPSLALQAVLPSNSFQGAVWEAFFVPPLFHCYCLDGFALVYNRHSWLGVKNQLSILCWLCACRCFLLR